MMTLQHFLGLAPTITLEQRNAYLDVIRVGRERLLRVPAVADLPDLGADAVEFGSLAEDVVSLEGAIEQIQQKLAPEGEEPAAFEEYPALTSDERTTLVWWDQAITRMAEIVAAHQAVSPTGLGAAPTTQTYVAGAALLLAGILVITLS